MEEIGLFPLGLVLLPTEQVPLHIFEPRYRELIAECLENEQPFGLVYADDDGLRRTGTLATVVEVVDEFEDGRLNIVVEGGDRFRLVELTDGRSFHTGTIEPFADVDDPPPPDDVRRGLGLQGDLLLHLLMAGVQVPRAGRQAVDLILDNLAAEAGGRPLHLLGIILILRRVAT